MDSWLSKDEVSLDNNHSHFLIVDDGSNKEERNDVKSREKSEGFRGKLEKYLMTKTMKNTDVDKDILDVDYVPTVLLVMEGNFDTNFFYKKPVYKKLGLESPKS